MPLGDELVAPGEVDPVQLEDAGDDGFVVGELPRVVQSGTANDPEVEPMTTCVMVTLPVRVLVPEGPVKLPVPVLPVPVTAFLLLPGLV